jgi:hypothetical protein
MKGLVPPQGTCVLTNTSKLISAAAANKRRMFAVGQGMSHAVVCLLQGLACW